MMIVLHPTYTFRVEIKDRAQTQTNFSVNPQVPYNPHRYWNANTGKTGCDEVLADLKKALAAAGIQAEIYFESFDHKGG